MGEEFYCVKQTQIESARLDDGPAVTFAVKFTISMTTNEHYWLCCPLKVVNGELISVLHQSLMEYSA